MPHMKFGPVAQEIEHGLLLLYKGLLLAGTYPIGYSRPCLKSVRHPSLLNGFTVCVMLRPAPSLLGALGDHKSVGEGVAELRIAVGPGYRVYYTHHVQQIVVLLCGGDKGSQRRDISKAKLLANQLE